MIFLEKLQTSPLSFWNIFVCRFLGTHELFSDGAARFSFLQLQPLNPEALIFGVMISPWARLDCNMCPQNNLTHRISHLYSSYPCIPEALNLRHSVSHAGDGSEDEVAAASVSSLRRNLLWLPKASYCSNNYNYNYNSSSSCSSKSSGEKGGWQPCRLLWQELCLVQGRILSQRFVETTTNSDWNDN